MANKLDTLTVNLSSAPHQRAFTTTTSPVVLFSVLDHYLRRDDPQTKVIGALLGVRSSDGTEVEIRNAFALIYTTEEDRLVVDREHYRSMYELHQRVNPEEIILGWYTAGADLTASCTPIHTFFAEDVAPFQPIHVTVDTEALFKTSDMGLRAYARYFFFFFGIYNNCNCVVTKKKIFFMNSAPVGFASRSGDCMFLSVPCEVKYLDAERSGCKFFFCVCV